MKPLKILHLYPKHLAIYGDYGNILCLQQRLAWRNLESQVLNHEIGDKLPNEFDLVFIGGGQDSGQVRVAKDIAKHAKRLLEARDAGIPMLAICGGYQLLGKHFKSSDFGDIPGIHLLNIVTTATQTRMIGNVVVESPEFGTLVGFENHSGATELLEDTQPLGKVRTGYGNSPAKQFEGARCHNIIGTYLHGSFLPKNPNVADWLLTQAYRTRGDLVELVPLDNWLEDAANKYATKLRS